MLAMVLEIATVLLGVSVGAVAVLYAAPRGYLGHPRRKASMAPATATETYTTPTEQASTPIVEVPAAILPAPSTAPEPAPYESVQPAPAPVTYSTTVPASFGAPTMTAKKPIRTYRRKSAPIRSTSVSKTTRNTKTKKR